MMEIEAPLRQLRIEDDSDDCDDDISSCSSEYESTPVIEKAREKLVEDLCSNPNPVNPEDPTYQGVPGEMLLHVIRVAFRRSPPGGGSFYGHDHAGEDDAGIHYWAISREWARCSPNHGLAPKTEAEKVKDLTVLIFAYSSDAPDISATTIESLYDRVSGEQFREVYNLFMRTLLEVLG